MTDFKYSSADEILEKAQAAINIPLGDIDKKGRLSELKGGIGHVIEESWFGYDINSDAAPDFGKVGVELKVTGFVRKGNVLRAKERLVLNIINYMEEYKKTFETSSFWHKNQKLLLMFYEYVKDKPKSSWYIEKAVLFQYPEEDLLIIRDDWEKIVGKIRAGLAHEISEGDTLYLGACTKGATAATSNRQQPCSNILARQRAYCLKNSYMSYILRTFIFGDENNERIIKNPAVLSDMSFEKYIITKLKPFFGKSQQELCKQFGIETRSKAVNQLIVSHILGLTTNLEKTEEFQKSNIRVKTIRVNANGSVTESMSFPAFNFCEIVKEEWKDSTFKEYIEGTRFLFIVFRYKTDNVLYLDDIIFWNIPPQDLEEVHKVWAKTVAVLKQGVELSVRPDGRIANNLPKRIDNRVMHVRPHAKDNKDTLPLPTGGEMPKQCFWFNNTYIQDIISTAKKRK